MINRGSPAGSGGERSPVLSQEDDIRAGFDDGEIAAHWFHFQRPVASHLPDASNEHPGFFSTPANISLSPVKPSHCQCSFLLRQLGLVRVEAEITARVL